MRHVQAFHTKTTHQPGVPVQNGQAESSTTQSPPYSNHMKRNKTSTQGCCIWRALAESQTTKPLSIPSSSDQIKTQMQGHPTKMGCANFKNHPALGLFQADKPKQDTNAGALLQGSLRESKKHLAIGLL